MTAIITNDGGELPAEIRLSSPDSFDIWLRWRVLEKKHLPYTGGFADQPEALMQDIILLDSVFDQLRKNYDGRQDD